MRTATTRKTRRVSLRTVKTGAIRRRKRVSTPLPSPLPRRRLQLEQEWEQWERRRRLPAVASGDDGKGSDGCARALYAHTLSSVLRAPARVHL